MLIFRVASKAFDEEKCLDFKVDFTRGVKSGLFQPKRVVKLFNHGIAACTLRV